MPCLLLEGRRDPNQHDDSNPNRPSRATTKSACARFFAFRTCQTTGLPNLGTQIFTPKSVSVTRSNNDTNRIDTGIPIIRVTHNRTFVGFFVGKAISVLIGSHGAIGKPIEERPERADFMHSALI